MRPTPACLPGRIRPGPLLAAFALLLVSVSASCREPTGSSGNVHDIAILVPGNTLRPGVIAFAGVELRDATGAPVEAPVTWKSLTPAILKVGALNGQLLATQPGVGLLRASAGGLSTVLELQLVNPPVATLDIIRDEPVHLALPNGELKLVVAVRDAEGGSIVGAPIAWESSAPRIAEVSALGVVRAKSAGEVFVVVHTEGLTDTAWVFVKPVASPNAPAVVAIAPQVALPGMVLQVDGARFAPTPAGNTVLLDGTPVTVTSATPERLLVTLPAASAFACAPTGPVTLQVTTAGGIGTGSVVLQMAPQRAMQPGESLVLPTGLESQCLELSPADGRFVVTVQNTRRSLGSMPMAFTLGGVGSSMTGAPLLVQAGAQLESFSSGALQAQPGLLRARPARPTRRARRADVAHQRLLEGNRTVAEASRADAGPDAGPYARRAPAESRMAALTAPGDVQGLRVLDLDVDPALLCSRFTKIGARTVFVGPHVIIVEDTMPTVDGQPTYARTMDDLYVRLGEEFESVVWPVLQKFGNPLVMDDRLDDNDRVVLVFTPRMNQMLGGALFATTTTCDLMPQPQRPSSNMGEYFYAQVPVNAGPGTDARAAWMKDIRATIAHELKHLVSYAERTVRGLPYEEVWLEEATARHAEELYARAIYGTAQLGNHAYEESLRCEVTAGASPCPVNPPRAMLPHFDALWEFLDASAARSPLGPVASGDYSYYGSAWSLTRWMLDHGGIAEADVFRALTQTGDAGVSNLEARFGMPWARMLGEWSLALATDDLADFTPASGRLRFPSWNLPSIFLGLCTDAGPCVNPGLLSPIYPRPNPLEPLEVIPGTFSLEFPSVPAGGFGAVELSGGTANTRQLLVLRGYQGAALPAEARLSIVRVQ